MGLFLGAREGTFQNRVSFAFPGDSNVVVYISSGLTNDEVALADGIISIPSFKHFSSLNLAQAVNIVGYELWKRCLEIETATPPAVW